MTHDEITQEAYDRLDRHFDRVGIDEPDEEFSQSELREMLAEERDRIMEDERKYGGWY